MRANAQICLTAGEKLMEDGDNKSAAKIFRKGIETLDKNCMEDTAPGANFAKYIALDLYARWAAAEILNTNFFHSLELAESLITRAKSKNDLAEAYELKIRTLMFLGRIEVAKECALELLEKFEISLTTEKPPEFLPQDFANLPETQVPWEQSVSRCIKALGEITFISYEYKLCLAAVLTAIRFCFEHGRSTLWQQCLVDYTLILCHHFGEVEKGYELGKFALESLSDEDELSKPGCREVFYAMISNSKDSVRNSIKPLEDTFAIGAKVGDFMMAGCSVLAALDGQRFLGLNLYSLELLYKQWKDKFKQLNLDYSLTYASIGQQLILDLKGENTTVFNKNIELEALIEEKQYTPVFLFCVCETMRAYILGSPQEALTIIEKFKKYKDAAFGLIISAEFNPYYSLSLIASLSDENKTLHLQQTAANQKIMADRAHHAPMNFCPKYLLVEAERYRILGEYENALQFYQQAIALAQKQDFTQDIALANELAGEFCLQQNDIEAAERYLQEARSQYKTWGVTAKVEQLEFKYPWLGSGLQITASGAIRSNNEDLSSPKNRILLQFFDSIRKQGINCECEINFLRTQKIILIGFPTPGQLDSTARRIHSHLAQASRELQEAEQIKLYSGKIVQESWFVKDFS